MQFSQLLESERIIVFDGAMGTSIQNANVDSSLWQGKEGCNEFLNIVCPEIISKIHLSFLDAGADVVETNTFGANSVVLSEYGLEEDCYKINKAAAEIAKAAVSKYSDRFVAGSIGPTTKLLTLGQIDFDRLYNTYLQQAEALIDGGVDLFIVETCQDLLQVKAAMASIFKLMEEKGLNLPVMLSVTVQDNGLMLLGSNIDAIITLAEKYPVVCLGFNCSVGPDKLYEPLKELSTKWSRLISCMPNAGLPKNKDGVLIYDTDAESFGKFISQQFTENLVDIVGGCCGTTPEYIRKIKDISLNYKKVKRSTDEYAGKASSLFAAFNLTQNPPPALVAERANVNGSKYFRELLAANDFNSMLQVMKDEEDFSHFIDISVAFPERNEIDDLTQIVKLANRSLVKPLIIDSTSFEAIQAALKVYAGKAIINSVHLEDGGVKLNKVFNLIKYFPASVVALCIDEMGMATESEKKFLIAEKIYNIWVDEFNYDPADLIIDTLTFSIGTGDKSLQFAAVQTIEAIKLIKKRLPKVKTILGVSNISFGLAKNSRPFLNTVFLNEAINAGLDLAIIDPKKIIPDYEIVDEKRHICLDLIYGESGSLMRFIEYFSDEKDITIKTNEHLADEELIKQKIIKGDKTGLEDILSSLLKKYTAFDIINNFLIESMKEVGDLFGKGKMLLPFVLESAEAMKKSVDFLKPFMDDDKNKTDKKGKIILATVKGDVHDIGKNLVDIILSNNGYDVYNLGIKVPAEVILEKYREIKPDAIGLSGLLVASAYVMKENIEIFKQSGVECKIMLGGAALTKSFVDNECGPNMKESVFYCKDAFDAIKYLEDSSSYKLIKVKFDRNTSKERQKMDEQSFEIKYIEAKDIPEVPFFGGRKVDNVNIDKIFKYLNRLTLYNARWGYNKKEMSDEEYDNMINKVALKELELMKKNILKNNILNPGVVYGYFRCKSSGNLLKIYNTESKDCLAVIDFPRQKKDPFISIADYFLDENNDSFDIIALQVVTIGDGPSDFLKSLFQENKFKEYYMYHGLFAELTEALAEYCHRVIRHELKIDVDEPQNVDSLFDFKYRGRRYSFGYPSCPNLQYNELIAKLLNVEDIGVKLTEGYQMVPEYTTSAFIVHNENAKYFTLR
jgi:5-methyltetrahydrofolate--homocysteine methyltransferase